MTMHERGRELIVGYPWHYCSRGLRAKEVVMSGELGLARYINSYFASTTIDFFRVTINRMAICFNIGWSDLETCTASRRGPAEGRGILRSLTQRS